MPPRPTPRPTPIVAHPGSSGSPRVTAPPRDRAGAPGTTARAGRPVDARASTRLRAVGARVAFAGRAVAALAALVAWAPAWAPAGAQTPAARPSGVGPVIARADVRPDTLSDDGLAAAPVRPTVPELPAAPAAPARRFRTVRDSLTSERVRGAAERAATFRVVISLEARQLVAMEGGDTLLVAPVAIGMDTTISYGARRWTFQTPRGVRTVLRKDKDPVWIPPDWHYAEVASKRGLALAWLRPGRPVKLSGGRTLVVRDGRAGVVLPDGEYGELPLDEEIIFDDTLYVPPPGTENRKIPGELGRFRLDMGEGYLLHGTPYEESVGSNVTHGCIRLYDADIEWLFERVPVGTKVYIY